MGYLHKRYGRKRTSMGDVVSTIENALTTSVSIATDPYFPEVVCRVGQIQQADAGQVVQVCANTTPDYPTALGRLITPIRMLAYAEQNKWAYFAAAAVVLGLPMWIGYEMGKGK